MNTDLHHELVQKLVKDGSKKIRLGISHFNMKSSNKGRKVKLSSKFVLYCKKYVISQINLCRLQKKQTLSSPRMHTSFNAQQKRERRRISRFKPSSIVNCSKQSEYASLSPRKVTSNDNCLPMVTSRSPNPMRIPQPLQGRVLKSSRNRAFSPVISREPATQLLPKRHKERESPNPSCMQEWSDEDRNMILRLNYMVYLAKDHNRKLLSPRLLQEKISSRRILSEPRDIDVIVKRPRNNLSKLDISTQATTRDHFTIKRLNKKQDKIHL